MTIQFTVRLYILQRFSLHLLEDVYLLTTMFQGWVWLNKTRHVQQKTIAHLWLFTGHTAHFLWIKFNRIITKLGLDKKKQTIRVVKDWLNSSPIDELENWCLKFWQGAWALQARAGQGGIHVNPVFICMWMKSNSHMKGWAPGLTLKKRSKAIWKWPNIESRILNWLNWLRVEGICYSIKAVAGFLKHPSSVWDKIG